MKLRSISKRKLLGKTPGSFCGIIASLSVYLAALLFSVFFCSSVFAAKSAISTSDLNSTASTSLSSAVDPKSKAVGNSALREDFLGDDEIDTELSNTDFSGFDHVATGFPLTGKHTQIDCQVCHLGGIFTELPTQCRACHNNTLSPGLPDKHLPTTDDCFVCHTTSGFAAMAAAVFDHSLIGNASCLSCHDGIIATGKSVNHFNSSDLCDNCHISTFAWTDTFFDHTGITQSCSECHNGVTATTYRSGHVPVITGLCETCHINTTWTVSFFDHDANVLPPCAECHSGTSTGVSSKGGLHIESSQICDACHSTTVWSPEIKVDHDHVSGTCFLCHNGVAATGMSAQHIKIGAGNICEACHLSTVWAPVRVVDHNEVVGSCSSCHNGVIARGQHAAHIDTSASGECNTCHDKSKWLPVFGAIEHATFSGNCISCHDSKTASGRGPNHIATSDVCDACHQKAPAVWASLLATGVDHAQILGSCVSCHDNVISTGKNVAHINTSDLCETCHKVFPTPWKPLLAADVDHSQVIGTCVSCHNNAPVIGKGASHIATTDKCEACHDLGTAPWIPVLPKKVNHDEVLGSCVSCHGNIKSTAHILSSENCASCHEVPPGVWAPLLVGRMNHNDVVGVCSSCHNGIIATGKHAAHIVTVEECNACHGVTAWLPAAQDHSTYVNNCITCHDGVIASGKTAAHFPASDSCDACHEKFPAIWRSVAAIAVDHNQLSGSCLSCHNGGFAPGKSANHMSTSDNCVACHAPGPIPWAPVLPAAVNHIEVLGACESCHNDVIARGKAGRHSVINTTNNCAACHAPSPVAWISVLPSAVDHNEVIGTCMSCHDGVIATGKNAIANHIVTTRDCSVCHSSTAWIPAGVDHATFSGNCITCHDGVTAGGKSLTHINTSDVCDACHDKAPGTWVNVAANRVDHTQLSGTCLSCHDTVVASGKSLNHILSSDTCDACHQKGGAPWQPVAKSAVDHAHVQGACVSCHDNTTASGKSALHMPTTDNCIACHAKGPALWTPVAKTAVNHADVVGVCVDCHDGGLASGKSASHMATTNECQACHKLPPVVWTTVATADVNHNHVQGTCTSCHNNNPIIGKSVNHIVTALECNQCHATTAWVPAVIDHTGFSGNCISCHNGVNASGKGTTHIISTDACDACHLKLPATWAPVAATAVDHLQLSGTCFSCHNNAPIPGKTTGVHIPSSNNCEKCHATVQFPVWRSVAPGAVDHLETQGLCADCHNGTLARGKGATHITTTLACDACHVVSNWLTTTVADHSTIINNCVSCHNGTTASGKTTAHVATSNNCELCHQKFPANWTPVAANAVNHAEVIGACDTCHNNLPISGKSANHPATSNNCSGCHNVGPAKWLPLLATINHTDALGVCVDCHIAGGIATGQSASHPTTTSNCAGCHNVSPTPWTSFITPLNHAEVLGSCVSCHNNVISTGKSAGHPATNDDCALCHSVPPTPWLQFISPLDHTQIFDSCVSCHTIGGLVGATPKSATHSPTTDICEACHSIPPTPWASFITPLDHNQVQGTCLICHSVGGTATPKSNNHPLTTDVCDACHNLPPQTWLPYISPVDHTQVLGSCVSCHATGGVATGKPGGHILSSDFCEACHNKPPLTWLPYIAPLDHNEVLGTCSSCHSFPAGHPNTTTICEACHSIPPTAWRTVITPLDHNQVLGSCVSCHTPGGVATPKSATHPLTTDVCDSCHAVPPTMWTTVFLPFAHTDALGLCTDCHATGIATPVNGGHCTPLGGDCDLCHTTTSFLNPTADCGAVTAPPAPGVAPPVPAPPPPPAAGMGGPGGMGGGMGM